jgi:hypothetical protein
VFITTGFIHKALKNGRVFYYKDKIVWGKSLDCLGCLLSEEVLARFMILGEMQHQLFKNGISQLSYGEDFGWVLEVRPGIGGGCGKD